MEKVKKEQQSILFMLLLLCVISCNGQNKKEDLNSKDNLKNTYFLNYDLSGDYEISFNGYSLSRNKKDGVKMSYEYLNPYISKTGKQFITLSLKPLDMDNNIDLKTLKEISLEVYSSENGENPPFKKIEILKLPEYKEAQKSVFYSWTFDAEVPFEINILDDAKDLKDEKPQHLLREVVAQYEIVHNLINSGDTATYMKLYKNSREREMISMYYDENKQNEYLSSIKQRTASSKNFMQPLKDYSLLIHPNNKIVSLVNAKGKSPLFSKDKKGKIKTYGLQLYRSANTGKLEVY